MHHVQGRIPSAPQPRVMALPSLVIFAPKDVDRRRAKAIRPSGSRVVVEPRVAHLQRGPLSRPQARQGGHHRRETVPQLHQRLRPRPQHRDHHVPMHRVLHRALRPCEPGDALRQPPVPPGRRYRRVLPMVPVLI